MAKYTNYLKLEKPNLTDLFDIRTFNNNIEKIEKGLNNKKSFTFFIQDYSRSSEYIEYQAEYGMTWREWVQSPYASFWCVNDDVYVDQVYGIYAAYGFTIKDPLSTSNMVSSDAQILPSTLYSYQSFPL